MEGKELGLWRSSVIGAIGLLVFLSLWEILVRTNVIDPFFLPAPTQVIDKAIQMTTAKDAVLLTDEPLAETHETTLRTLYIVWSHGLWYIMQCCSVDCRCFCKRLISVTVLVLDILFRGLERVLLPYQRKTSGT